MSRWTSVTKATPCPACGKPDHCAWTPDGDKLRCMRAGDPPNGMRLLKTDRDGGTLYVFDDKRNGAKRHFRSLGAVAQAKETGTKIDWREFMPRLRAKLAPERLAALAKSTGVPAWAWAKLSPGWADADDLRTMRAGGAGWEENRPTGAYVFAEHRGDGAIVGVSLRAEDGRKGSPSSATGSRRGLVLPTDLHDLRGEVLIVEGASDVAASRAQGIPAVGRPSNRAGVADLAIMLDGLDALVVGERDGKPDGSWPGRDGAKAVAQQLAGRWGLSVLWTLPPLDTKDIRAGLLAKIAGGLDTDNAEAMKAAGVELLDALKVAAKQAKPERRSMADTLVDLAMRHYRLGTTLAGEAFAVPLDGPAVAILFKGGASALRATLARRYREANGKTPNAAALADALTGLEGIAMDSEPEPVALRIAELPPENRDDGDGRDDAPGLYPRGLVLDLGTASGQAVVITPDGWQLVDVSPVLFRRTALTGPLPVPADAGDLHELRSLLNVTDEAWPLVVGWLVATFFPLIPHPVLLLGGEQGTGKSTAARLIVGLVDASPALLRSEPRDPEQWAMAASGSWCVVIDNVSHISAWLSDAMCKAVTGDGWIRRKLYTDSDLAVLNFRRCLMLTSIDAGALRGDLGDRLLLVDLERIADSARRTEAELDAAYRDAAPRLLAGLLTVVSRTLAALPGVQLDGMPRMADFARLLAALDIACPELTRGRALELFIGQRQRIAGDVVEADLVAAAVLRLVETHGAWSGTAAELLDTLTPRDRDGKPRPPRGWPGSARGMSGQLKRIVPALRAVGIEVEYTRAAGGNRERHVEIRKTGVATVPTVPTVPNTGIAGSCDGTVGGDGSPPCDPQSSRNRPGENPDDSGTRDDRDGSSATTSNRVRVRL